MGILDDVIQMIESDQEPEKDKGQQQQDPAQPAAQQQAPDQDDKNSEWYSDDFKKAFRMK
jgi:hypothetical protein